MVVSGRYLVVGYLALGALVLVHIPWGLEQDMAYGPNFMGHVFVLTVCTDTTKPPGCFLSSWGPFLGLPHNETSSAVGDRKILHDLIYPNIPRHEGLWQYSMYWVMQDLYGSASKTSGL